MFIFNSKTLIEKDFKTKDILKLINASKEIKKDASEIQKITLKNVISNETTGLNSSEECKEIYIIEIVVSEKRVPLEFIKAFDKIIELHTYFIIKYKNEEYELIIYRNNQDAVIKRSATYKKSWTSNGNEELPYSMSIEEVYNNLLFSLIDLPTKPQEKVNCFLERFNKIQKLKKAIETLEKKAFKENQPRKKFDLGRELKSKKEELRSLEG